MLTKVLPNWLDKATLDSFANPQSTEHFQSMCALNDIINENENGGAHWVREKAVEFAVNKMIEEGDRYFNIHDFRFKGVRHVVENYFQYYTHRLRSAESAREALINPLSNVMLWVNSLPDVERE